MLRNPLLFVFLVMLAGGLYVAHSMNLLGPMMRMANAAASQGVEMARQSLREFLESSDTVRAALDMPARGGGGGDGDVAMERLDSRGRRVQGDDDDDI